jgi:hypothetical protein
VCECISHSIANATYRSPTHHLIRRARAIALRAIPILWLDLPRAAFLSRYNATMQQQPKSLPSELEIADACAAIRLNWTANEFRRRTNASSDRTPLARSSDVYWYQPTVNLTLDGAPT